MTKILLINPPVYDFAAYDLWAKPLSLLYLSSIFKKQNIKVDILDYMDRHLINATSTKYGCGHYCKEEIQKPEVIRNIKRKYFRFGIPKDIAEAKLLNMDKPDIVIINSVMTYWYLGVIEAVDIIRKKFKDIPVVLGGIYATLCCEHAGNIKGITDIVAGDFYNINKILKKYSVNIYVDKSFYNFPHPDYSNYNNLEYIAIKMSSGCPFKCSYCAQHILNTNGYVAKSPYQVKEEILYLIKSNIKNIAFYDDALLYDADNGIKILLKEFINDNKFFNFHTPNGLHAKYVDEELADLLYNAKFIQPRFSLETSDFRLQKQTGGKINNKEFERTIKYLQKAGYKKGEYTAYLLIGMPEQTINEIEASILFSHNLGAKISLSEYSPISKTKDSLLFGYNYDQEPLLQNNTYFVSNSNYLSNDDVLRLKKLAKDLNNKL